MSVTKEQVLHVAKLSKLFIDENDVPKMTNQLEGILSFVDKLNELDTENVAPCYQVIPVHNVFREDAKEASLDRDKLLQNAPETDGISFIVPKVVE